jgi:hypothetical protein
MESDGGPAQQKHALAVVEASPGFVDHWTCTGCGWYFAFGGPRPFQDVKSHEIASDAFHLAHTESTALARSSVE